MTYSFVHIPKTSGVSLDRLIQAHPSCNLEYLQHVRVIDMVKYFTFVRNPYDRIVSAYFYLKSNKDNETQVAYSHIVSRYKSFRDFVLKMDRDGLLDFMLHLKPQWTWVVDENGTVIPKVFKIEEPELIDAFLAENGASGWLEFPKENTSEHEPYETYLDEDVIAEINRLYARDFELFNYDKL